MPAAVGRRWWQNALPHWNLQRVSDGNLAKLREAKSMQGELLRKLFAAHAEGDKASFRVAAREIIDDEYRRKHTVLARELERLLNGKNGSTTEQTQFLTLASNGAHSPRDRDRGGLLVEMSEAQRRLGDLVFTTPTRNALDRVIEEQRRAEVIRSHGLQPRSKILFCGPPGCGKTVAAEAVAKETYLPLSIVRFDAVISSYLGETAANLRKVFEFARSRPMVMLFDEFDAIGKRRTDPEEHGEVKRVVNSFLQMLDGLHGETLTIAATNHQGLLDPALWRRFDEIIFFPLPTAEEIERLLIDRLRQVKVSPAVGLAAMARSLIGRSHGDIERLAIEMIKRVILRERNEIDAQIATEVLEEEHARTKLVDAIAAPASGEARPTRRSSGSRRKKR